MKAIEEDLLLQTIKSLDISPSDYKLAQERYSAVARWLEDGAYQNDSRTNIYLQGSFRLGTVIRPYRDAEDADFDIDQVCEIVDHTSTPFRLKHDVGDRLKEHATYRRLLDEEGKRCWTLIYASTEDRPGFHLDVLPSRPDDGDYGGIDITHKKDGAYTWKSSNPRGYYAWFKSRNRITSDLENTQKTALYRHNPDVYASISEVPRQLIRTTLQRSIQFMKRHRDVMFDGKEYSPISIIITTICTHLYKGLSVSQTIDDFVEYVLNRLCTVEEGGDLKPDGVLDFDGVKWVVLNPADHEENFADKWEQENDRAKAFFSWVIQLKRDFRAFEVAGSTRDLHLGIAGATRDKQSLSDKWLLKLQTGEVDSNEELLTLIHHAVLGECTWKDVRNLAVRNVDEHDKSTDPESKDIAWVNFCQVVIHSGRYLEQRYITIIRQIRSRYQGRANFEFCCSLILGEATPEQYRLCVAQVGSDIFSWPILRLANGQFTENARTIIPYL